jgi:hypothetical protein
MVHLKYSGISPNSHLALTAICLMQPVCFSDPLQHIPYKNNLS